MLRHSFSAALAFGLLWITACTNRVQELSRDRAARLIAASPQLQAVRTGIRLQQGAYERALRYGYVNPKGALDVRAAGVFRSFSRFDAVLTQPSSSPLVTVTGIADAATPGAAQGVKEVQFSWEYDGLPSLAKRFAVAGGTGVAYLRLYDDGWRVEHLEIAASRNPALLDSSSEQAEKGDAAAVLAAEGQAAAAARAQAARVADMTARSKMSTHTFGTHTHYADPRGAKTTQLTVTDATISFRDVNSGIQCDLWLGSVSDLGKSAHILLGYTVFVRTNPHQCQNSEIFEFHFRTEQARDAFFEDVRRAIHEWQDRWPDLPHKVRVEAGQTTARP
jgi:hypothetical protein